MPLSIGKMTVNVSLCGAIPRSHMPPSPLSSHNSDSSPGARYGTSLTSSDKSHLTLSSPKYSCLAALGCANGRAFCESDVRSTKPPNSHFVTSDRPSLCTVSLSEDSDDTIMPINSHQVRLQPLQLVEPPLWAVPAKGQARLEPVCEALGSHHVVDLTARPCFRVGRSPASDVQLMHNTSSRRHALLFHHPNGSCYVVDCGSAHGTYVNGVRVRNTPSSGMVVPHRVRRGALIRFGGPGAPSFVLKSFSVGFSYMVKEDLETPSCSPTHSPTMDTQKQVKINTHLNALGTSGHVVEGGILKKRSMDEFSDDERSAKRRCISPLQQSPESSPVRLVSPDPGRRVTFNDVPQAFYPSLVSPDLSSDDVSLEE